jgi:hypothetical protein
MPGVKELAAGARAVVVHDPAEVKNADQRRVFMAAGRLVSIRLAAVATLSAALGRPVAYAPHPFVTPAGGPSASDGRRFNAISLARIDWDKHTDIVIEANRQLVGPGEWCMLAGAENRMYAYHKLTPRWPDWRKALISTPQRNGIRAAAMARYMVDMSVIAGDGGGTQYTFFEAWAGGAHLVVNRGWLRPGGELTDGVNCTAVADGDELAARLRRPPDAAVIAGGREVLAAHDAKAMAALLLG